MYIFVFCVCMFSDLAAKTSGVFCGGGTQDNMAYWDVNITKADVISKIKIYLKLIVIFNFITLAKCQSCVTS